MLSKYCLMVGLWLFPFYAIGQDATIKGHVKERSGEPIPDVEIAIQNSQEGTTTGEQGYFTLSGLEADDYQVTVSSVGFYPKAKTVNIGPNETVNLSFELEASIIKMEEMVITGTMQNSYVKESPVKVEVLNQGFLENDPENNVMESIDNVNGVQKQVNCGVCGTNAIRINGMEGPYTLMLIDGMPIMSNLASVYGFNGIPNSLVKQIEVVKGPNSTLYGTEAMGGVINVRTKDPQSMPLVNANTYYTSHGEWNTDVSASADISEDIHTTVSANYFRNRNKYDFNDDNFIDLVLNDRLSLFNKWHFDRDNGKEANIAARYYSESRLGGTMDFEHSLRGSDSIYGESIKTERVELIGNYDLPFDQEDVRLDFSYSQHKQDSYYGTEHYKAEQSTLFANLIWNKQLVNHKLLMGLTGRWEQYEDNSPAETNFNAIIPGVFVQDEWSIFKDLELLSGMRLDYQGDHGPIFSPRLNLKYEFDQWTTARLNIGTGFRQVHLFTEDHAALTGAREVEIREDLAPETSYNATFNVNHVYQTRHWGTGDVSLDVFYTHFRNKIIPDYDLDPNLVVYKNLEGYGISRGVSLSISHDFEFPLNFKLGGSYQQAYEVNESEGQQLREPINFTPAFSGNFSLQYQWNAPDLSLSYTGNVMGPEHLPEFKPPYNRPERSRWYTIQNIKVAKELHHNLTIYGGVKNLLNWTQPSPLIDPENPFGENFDTIYAYGPLQPRRFYLGLKWHLD